MLGILGSLLSGDTQHAPAGPVATQSAQEFAEVHPPGGRRASRGTLEVG